MSSSFIKKTELKCLLHFAKTMQGTFKQCQTYELSINALFILLIS